MLYNFKWHDKKAADQKHFKLRPPFYKSRRDKHLSKLLPLVCCHSRTILDALSCSLITFIQVLQI